MDEHWTSSGSSSTNTGPGNPGVSGAHTTASGGRTPDLEPQEQRASVFLQLRGHEASMVTFTLSWSWLSFAPQGQAMARGPMFAPFLGLLRLAGCCPRGKHPPHGTGNPDKAPLHQLEVTKPLDPCPHSPPPSVTLHSQASVCCGVTRRS